jgi:hypothetical protein
MIIMTNTAPGESVVSENKKLKIEPTTEPAHLKILNTRSNVATTYPPVIVPGEGE